MASIVWMSRTLVLHQSYWLHLRLEGTTAFQKSKYRVLWSRRCSLSSNLTSRPSRRHFNGRLVVVSSNLTTTAMFHQKISLHNVFFFRSVGAEGSHSAPSRSGKIIYFSTYKSNRCSAPRPLRKKKLITIIRDTLHIAYSRVRGSLKIIFVRLSLVSLIDVQCSHTQPRSLRQ